MSSKIVYLRSLCIWMHFHWTERLENRRDLLEPSIQRFDEQYAVVPYLILFKPPSAQRISSIFREVQTHLEIRTRKMTLFINNFPRVPFIWISTQVEQFQTLSIKGNLFSQDSVVDLAYYEEEFKPKQLKIWDQKLVGYFTEFSNHPVSSSISFNLHFLHQLS